MKYLRRSFLLAVALIFSSIAASAQETGGVKGKVRTTRGNPIGGVVVTARQKGADVKSVTAEADGKFVLNGLAPGIYNIAFDKTGYATGVKYNVEIKKNSTGDLGDRLILTADQGTQTIIKGSVFNQSDKSVGGARVEVERISGDGSTRKVGSGFTNVSGEFTFRFPEGEAKYRVTATAKNARASKEIDVSSAAIYRLAITLKVKE